MAHTLLQITDCHLGIEAGDKLLGLDADQSLAYVLADLFAQFPTPDLLVCSGDLSNDGDQLAPYQRLSNVLPAEIDQIWLPGNHDENALIADVVRGCQQFLGTYSLGNWQITALDSSIPHAVPGFIAESELQRAVDVLEANPTKHHLIFMHHHLKPVGCKWLDTQVIGNAEQVLAKFAQYPQLKMITCGHVHQETAQQAGHLHLYSTPSTCIQFKPNSDQFAVGNEMPGFRWFTLFDDGRYETGVSRISERELSIDHHSTGY